MVFRYDIGFVDTAPHKGCLEDLRRTYTKELSMRVWYATLLSTIAALTWLVMAPTWAGEHKGHVMVTPGDLQWVDVPSLPAGAKLAVIEGPITEAAPFTFRLKLPANYKVPLVLRNY